MDNLANYSSLAADQDSINRRRKIQEAILQQNLHVPQGHMAGRFYVPTNPMQYIAALTNQYVANDNLKNTDTESKDLSKKYQDEVAKAMIGYEQTKSGTLGKTLPPTTPNDDEGNINPNVTTAAVPGNPRKAVTDALINPFLAHSPLVASDLKEIQETPPTRKIQVGDEEVTQELQPDRTWKEVGRGPKFAKQVAPSITNQAAVTPVTIQDPKDTNKTIIVDGRTMKVIGAGPKLTDTGKLENKRQFNMQGIGKTIKDAEDLLNGTVVEDGITKSVPKPTGSGIGTVVDAVGGFFGASPSGSVQAQKMKAIGGALTSKMPRMEGPQSDKDVALYKEMAAQVGDSTVPIDRRLAALGTVKDLWAKYERLNPDAFDKPAAASSSSSSPRVVDW